MTTQTHKWLPSEPTEDMKRAMYADNLNFETRENIYKAMWQAATEVDQGPVRYEFNWKKGQSEWYGWGECNKELYERYTNNPFYFDGFEYQARALYAHPQPKQQPLTEDQIREICSKVSKESGFDLSPATFVLAFRAAEKEYGVSK